MKYFLKCVLLVLSIYEINMFKSDFNYINVPDYDFPTERKPDIRKTFLKKNKNKLKTQKLVEILDQSSNTTEFFEDVPHLYIGKKKLKKILYIENDFLNVIGMVGATYKYKRDMYWRTWRDVLYPNGSKEIVCYRCQSETEESNRTNCHLGGHWIIEETRPPCFYEIFSIVNGQDLCGFNYTTFLNVNKTCPSLINYDEFTSNCENPIKTKWIVTPTYRTEVSERAGAVICAGREHCEFFTTYQILPKFIIFRIINSTNDIIYSRIMKEERKNYVCVDDCGRLDMETMKISRDSKPFIFDLLENGHKNKREDKVNCSLNTVLRYKYLVEGSLTKRRVVETTKSFCNEMLLKHSDEDSGDD